MEKTTITICSGTLCYVMGGASLLSIADHIPHQLKDKVIIKGSPCLEYCKNPENGKPPFVEVNGKMISEADVDSIIELLTKE